MLLFEVFLNQINNLIYIGRFSKPAPNILDTEYIGFGQGSEIYFDFMIILILANLRTI